MVHCPTSPRWVFGVLLLAVSGAMATEPGQGDSSTKMTDDKISQLLVGKWTVNDKNDKGRKVEGTLCYKIDGTFEAGATISEGDKSLKFTLSGTWKVSEGVLIDTVTKTSVPSWIEEGHVSKDRVISINENEFKYQREIGGQEIIRKRIAG